MAKLIAVVAVLSSIACGSGSNEPPALPGTTRSANAVTGACTNTPDDCGVKVCVDCTANAPPGTEPACVASKCTFPCAPGFHNCSGSCLSDTDASSCGSRCDPCPQPANGSATCVSGVCDFRCDLGFGKTGAFCASLSFSLSY
jgi:hypothetical protein